MNIIKMYGFKIHYRVLLWAMIALFTLTACQGQAVHRAYQGEAMPADKLAGFFVPAKFNILYIDDQPFETSILGHGITLELLPGKHQLVVEYDELWDITSDDHDRITSQPVLLSFTVKPGRQYGLQSTQIKGIDDARAYAKQPKVEIVEQRSRQTIPVAHRYRLGDKKFTASFTADRPAMDNADKNNKAPQMLEYWWQQADDAQQQNFLNWAKSHRKTGEE